MPSKPQAGRLYYSFNPSESMLENLAKPSGPRPTLISVFYLIGQKGNKVEEGLKTLEKWRKYSEGYALMLDSGVFTLRSKLGFGIHQGVQIKTMTEEGRNQLQSKGLKNLDEMDGYVKSYCRFLQLAEGLYDSAVEMDVDHFMGIDHADRYYKQICDAIGPRRVMRVFHQMFRTWSDWEEWMKDPETEFHCMEGGIMHKRDPEFYRTYINLAHANKKRIHVLALTVPDFMKKVPTDTSDSSTFVNGGRYGSIKVPGIGEITFSDKTDLTKNTAATNKHYKNITAGQLETCKRWFALHGFTMEKVLEDHYTRSILNIFYHDAVVDVPYQPQSQSLNIFQDRYI
jgi:hypothetical protein